MKTKSKVKVKSKRDETVIKCPECGATFRVGKALVQTKGEAASRRLFKTEVPLPTSGEDAASPLRNTRKRKETKMKLKIDWKTLGRMIWDAVKPDVDVSVVPK